jgi:hypothetical protein
VYQARKPSTVTNRPWKTSAPASTAVGGRTGAPRSTTGASAALPPGLEEDAVTEAAATRGVRVQGLGDHVVRLPRPPALVLGYAALAPSAIEDAVRELAAAVESIRSGSP